MVRYLRETLRTIYNRKQAEDSIKEPGKTVVSNDTKKSKEERNRSAGEQEEPAKPKDNRGGAREGAGRAKMVAPLAVGMRMAEQAVICLRQIGDDDPERDDALAYVQDWINKNKGEKGKQHRSSRANHQGRPSGSKDPGLSLQ
jgi:hypothetical protein